jgi:NAD(P)-dependent dehydrogenase (short-subunit alcohol dehydrogenase family)
LGDQLRGHGLFININYKAILNGIKTIVPRILKHGEGGHVVSTSSKNGLIPLPGMVLYNSTKRAVMAIMETLAIDLEGTGVGASVFCPGPFETNLNKTTDALREKHLGSAFAPFDPSVFPNAGVQEKRYGAAHPESDEAGGARLWRDQARRPDHPDHSEWSRAGKAHAAASRGHFRTRRRGEFMRLFSMQVANPIYDKQTQVPAYKKDAE